MTYRHGEAWKAGVVVESVVYEAARVLDVFSTRAESTVHDYVRDEGLADALRARLIAPPDRAAVGDFGDLELGPPILTPSKIICVGLNYKAHADEVLKDVSGHPTLFAKFANSLTGPRAVIEYPGVLEPQIDYEGELAVVIGRRCRRVAVESALEHVFGAMVLNDLTSRRLQYATTQWTTGKAIDSFAPCGPALVSLDDVSDLQDLNLTTTVNGTVVQSANTGSMIWSVAELVSLISKTITLEPGDIISTGTPSGIGSRRTPPMFLDSGDVVEVSIDQLGSIRNEMGPQ